MSKPKDNVIRLRAHPSLILRVLRMARLKDRNASEVIRNAISEYIEREEAKQFKQPAVEG